MSRPSFGGDLFSPDSPQRHLNNRNSGKDPEILGKNSPLTSTQSKDLGKESKDFKRKNLFQSENDQRTASKVASERVHHSSNESEHLNEVAANKREQRSKKGRDAKRVSSKNQGIPSQFITVRGRGGPPSITISTEEKENDVELPFGPLQSEVKASNDQIRGEILEKLIDDAVRDKFHGLRMQLHSMHLSLLTAFGKRMDEMEKTNENFLKVIGELLEENRQLRNMVLGNR